MLKRVHTERLSYYADQISSARIPFYGKEKEPSFDVTAVRNIITDLLVRSARHTATRPDLAAGLGGFGFAQP
jgi:hypothetical protein